ncbi:GNAT family N-acetyltransferase [Curtobacterium sp. Leaf261]|uniref:GNAT family N-acetyltransferase n=1 Tax=Curtobacterium sp. Leaf261 TaxID=1736311 RepID=UPI0006F8E726|nr:GNAT family protein [Curtobacterium sp. Leaf261]KQO61339.1 GCN5 family acetyltransferase [Curtobacterium sp. Leaf261]
MFSLDIADGVVLRPLEVWHAPAFAAHMDRAREHIRPWVGPAFVTDTEDGARATIRRYADTAAADGARLYGLWDGDTIVGGVMFVTFDAAWGTAEVGCWLEPGAEGRGLVTRSVTALLDWAFDVRGLTRVECRCRSDNASSVAVAERLGMHSEGIARSAWVFAGTRYDKQVFSVLRDEWRDRG